MKALKVSVFILVSLNLVLLYKLAHSNRLISHNTAQEQLPLLYAPHFILLDINGREWSLDAIVGGRVYSVLVFFTLDDCASCLMEYTLWNRIDKDITGVVGIAQHEDERELKIWTENAGIRFPVLNDKKGEIANLFQIGRTPTKVLIDKHGRIVLIDPVRIGPGEFNDFILILKKIVANGAN